MRLKSADLNSNRALSVSWGQIQPSQQPSRSPAGALGSAGTRLSTKAVTADARCPEREKVGQGICRSLDIWRDLEIDTGHPKDFAHWGVRQTENVLPPKIPDFPSSLQKALPLCSPQTAYPLCLSAPDPWLLPQKPVEWRVVAASYTQESITSV